MAGFHCAMTNIGNIWQSGCSYVIYMCRCTSWNDVSSSRNIFPLLNENTSPASYTSHPHRFEELLLDHFLLIHRGLKRRKDSFLFIPVDSDWHLQSFFCGLSFAKIPHRLDLFTNTGLKAGNFFIGTRPEKIWNGIILYASKWYPSAQKKLWV